MFIIFGWEKIFKPLESLLKTHCFQCKKNTNWSLWKETEWLSLFFINIFPFINKHHISCDICGDSTILINKFAKIVIKPEERNEQLHDDLVELIESHQFSSMTEGQITYQKSQIENRDN